MPTRLFVLTGCARSGLRHTSQALTALGAPCGHEEVLSLESFRRSGTLFWPGRRAGDASWLAAPVLGKLPERAIIFHQVRHPLATIHGLYSSGFFEQPSDRRSFVEDFLPETKLGGPLVKSMRFWLEWNRMAEGAEDYDDLQYHRFRAEDFEGDRVCEIAALLGLVRDRSTVARVLASTPGRDRVADLRDMSWDRLPAGNLRDELMATAERYGYGESVRLGVGA
jgi:hypothetical protein